MYYIDPNQGNPADAFLVYCSFSLGGQTCLSPVHSQVKHNLRLLSGLISDPERLLWPFVHCVFRKLIRIHVLQVPVKAWLKDSQEDSFSWLSRTEQGFQVCYTQSSGDLLPCTGMGFFFVFFFTFSILCSEVWVYRNQCGSDEVPAAKQQAGHTEYYFLLRAREQAGFEGARNQISCWFSETEFLGDVTRLHGMFLFTLFQSIYLTCWLDIAHSS